MHVSTRAVRLVLGWLLVAIAAGSLVGCDGSGKYTGTWEVDKEAMREAMDAGAAESHEEFGAIGEALAREMGQQLVSSLTMTLEVEGDGTWTMTGVMMGNDIRRGGRWSLEDGVMVMTSDSGPEVRATVEEGRLWLDRGEGEEMRLAFVRGERG